MSMRMLAKSRGFLFSSCNAPKPRLTPVKPREDGEDVHSHRGNFSLLESPGLPSGEPSCWVQKPGRPETQSCTLQRGMACEVLEHSQGPS